MDYCRHSQIVRFTRYSCTLQQLLTLAEITDDTLALRAGTEGLLEEMVMEVR